ncbi:MAG: TonB-dependent receptor [Bacteroidia bacterium]|nr:TonB-dependent receptor [Bacteroidia bacterium]
MKKTLIMCLLMSICIITFSQTITIKDNETDKPIEGVILLSDKPKAFSITNAKGQANISEFNKAEKIKISSIGYKNIMRSYFQLQTSNFELRLEQTNFNLEEIVISGTRWRQSSPDVPSKIIKITSKEVEFQNPQTAADLLGISGKVFIQKSQQGGGSPMIRGSATNRLIYTVDGVRMNTAIFRRGNIQNVINLDPFATEYTEVLFGPGSVIYGSDAIGGVMSFQTLTPQLSMTDKLLITGKTIARYSSANNEKTGHFDVKIGWKKWAIVTSFSSWDFDNLRQGSKGPNDYIKDIYVQRQDSTDVVIKQNDPLLQIPTAYSQFNMMQKIRFKPNKKWDFQYGFHYSVSSPFGRYDRLTRFSKGTIRYAEWNYGPQKWMMNNISITHNGNNIAYDEMTIRLAQQSFEESRIDRTLHKVNRNTQTENVEASSINIDFNKKTNSKNTLYYGVEYVFDNVLSVGKITDIKTGAEQKGPSRYPLSTWTSIGAYLNDQYKLSEKLLFQAGARYNRFIIDSDFDTTFYPFAFTNANVNNSALTGSLGFIYRPTKNWVINANAGTAFRTPNVDDIGKVADSEPGSVVVPNPGLKAEYAYNFDFGIAKIFKDLLKVDISCFYTIINNSLVRRDFLFNGQDSIIFSNQMSKVQAIQNAAVTNVYGLQAEVEIKLPSGFSYISDFNFQAGKDELDDGTKSPSRHAPPFYGVNRLRFKKNNLMLELNTIYQGKMSFDQLPEDEKAKVELYAKDANGNNYAPAWHTVNFKAFYQYSENLSISSGVENITDQRYRPYSSGVSGAGRNFIISLKANF